MSYGKCDCEACKVNELQDEICSLLNKRQDDLTVRVNAVAGILGSLITQAEPACQGAIYLQVGSLLQQIINGDVPLANEIARNLH